jgi:hypothetical protein
VSKRGDRTHAVMSSRTSCVVAAPIAAVAPSKDKSKRLARKIFDRLVDQKKKNVARADCLSDSAGDVLLDDRLHLGPNEGRERRENSGVKRGFNRLSHERQMVVPSSWARTAEIFLPGQCRLNDPSASAVAICVLWLEIG